MTDRDHGSRPSLMAMLRSDFIHQKAGTWYEKDISSPGVLGLLKLYVSSREFKVAARFRFAHWCHHRNLRVLAKWLYLRTKVRLGVAGDTVTHQPDGTAVTNFAEDSQ